MLLLQKTPELESLNVSSCRHLTDRSIHTIIKRLPNLVHLNIAGVRQISQEAIISVLTSSSKLRHLDLFDNKNLTSEGRETVAEIARQRNITLVLKGLTDADVAPENPSAVLELWKSTIT